MKPLFQSRLSQMIGYFIWFQTVFFVLFYLFFPIQSFQMQLQQYLQSALSQAFGKPLQVSVDSLSLWRLSGVHLRDVTLTIPTVGHDLSPQNIRCNDFKLRLSLLPLFMGRKTISWQAQLENQSMHGQFSIRSDQQLSSLSFSAPSMDLSQIKPLTALAGLPMQGQLSLQLNSTFAEVLKDQNGSFAFLMKQGRFGPGDLFLPAALGLGDSVNVPEIALGNAEIQVRVSNGKLELQTMRLSDGDVQAQAEATANLRKNWLRSPVSGSGWFSLKEDFLKKNPLIRSLLSFNPQLKRAKNSQGQYGFAMEGTLQRPRFLFKKVD